MKIYPAMDLIGGKCVRLSQGDFTRSKVYDGDPAAVAAGYAAAGAEYLHIIDLDGAKDGAGRQSDLIRSILAATGLKAQVGGGVRDAASARRYMDAGAQRVIIGSFAVKDPAAAKSLIGADPDKVVLAVDVRIENPGAPRVAYEGWQKSSGLSAWEFIKDFAGAGLRHVLCTDISRDGMGTGPNTALYTEMADRFPALHIQASGGVGSLEHIKGLAGTGAESVIIGKALFEGKFSLKEALAC